MQTAASTRGALLPSCSYASRRPGRGACVVVRAQDKFARNVISLPKQPGEVQVEGESTVTFLGSKGAKVSIVCPKVSWGRGVCTGSAAGWWMLSGFVPDAASWASQ